jgi:hypothetical protein
MKKDSNVPPPSKMNKLFKNKETNNKSIDLNKMLFQSNINFSPDSLYKKGKIGTKLLIQLRASGKTPVCNSSIREETLPPGVNYNNKDMTLEGTPEKEGEYSFTLHVQTFGTNVSGEHGSKLYKLTIVSEDYKGSDIYSTESMNSDISLELSLDDLELKF